VARLAAEHTEFIIESALALFLSELAIRAEFRGGVGGGVGNATTRSVRVALCATPVALIVVTVIV